MKFVTQNPNRVVTTTARTSGWMCGGYAELQPFAGMNGDEDRAVSVNEWKLRQSLREQTHTQVHGSLCPDSTWHAAASVRIAP